MISIIYFDLGGVIFTDIFSGGVKEFENSLHLSSQLIQDLYVKTDIPEYSKGTVSDRSRWKFFAETLGLPDEKIQACIDAFYKGYKPIYQTISFIKTLKRDRKDIEIGVLSDQPSGVAQYLRKQYNEIFSLFKESLILISAEINLSKKEKDLKIYQEAIKRSQKSPQELLFVDNSLKNVQNAQSLGINGFYYNIKEKDLGELLRELERKISN